LIINGEIRGNKYSIEELDDMLNDYLIIGENVYKLRKKKVEILFKKFIEKYHNTGLPIITKEKYKKQFLSSAKDLYNLAEFYFCQNAESFLEDKRLYTLRKDLKGARVYLYFKDEACIGIIYDSIPFFLRNWFILRRVLEE